MARKPCGLHPEDIKGRLRKKFGTLTAFARSLGRNPNTISNAICTPGYSVPLERQIADALEQKPQEIWPDRFHLDGSPISFRVDRTPTALRGADQRANEVAA